MTIYYDKSLLRELLIAIIPYTRQNLLLTFRPNQFFNELEYKSKVPQHKLRNIFNRAKRSKIISLDNNKITISLKGRQIIQPFIAKKLANHAELMVIFDIPEEHAGRRQRLRNLLKQLEFKQIQLSVWMTNKDHRVIVKESIIEFNLETWVQLYEASPI